MSTHVNPSSNNLHENIIILQREKSALTTWLILSICLYLPLLSLFLVHTFWAKWAHTSGGAAFGVHVAYKLYLFWVVFCFIREIKYYSRINFALRKLSDQDIEEFVYGNPAIPPEDEDDGEKFAGIRFDFMLCDNF